MYFYKVPKVLKIIDGDTIDVEIDLGFGIYTKQRIRLSGYDAPETYRPKTEAEYKAGEKCAKYLSESIDQYKDKLYIKTEKHIGLYGRYIGELFYKNKNEYISINQMLVEYIQENNFYKSILRETRG